MVMDLYSTPPPCGVGGGGDHTMGGGVATRDTEPYIYIYKGSIFGH